MELVPAVQQMPQLEVFHRVLELPVIELALNKSASTYTRLKSSHYLLYWALTTAESSLTTATSKAAPYAKKLETPINFVDHTLCRGLDEIEKKVPIVREKPELILENAYMLVLGTIEPAVSRISYANDLVASQAASIKAVSWNKLNQILSTRYGSVAVNGLDNTAVMVETLIDKYFPPMGEEEFPESVSMEEDKLLHSLQTVGRLSNKAARRVFAHVVHQLRTLSKDNLKTYLNHLMEFLQVAHYIEAVNDRIFYLSNSWTSTRASSPW